MTSVVFLAKGVCSVCIEQYRKHPVGKGYCYPLLIPHFPRCALYVTLALLKWTDPAGGSCPVRSVAETHHCLLRMLDSEWPSQFVDYI